jgi:spore coat protein JB
MNNDKKNLLAQLSGLEFCAHDVALYLDTHPEDKRAIAEYNRLAGEADAVRGEYQRAYGSIFSDIGQSDPSVFSWIEEPWPWEGDFSAKRA